MKRTLTINLNSIVFHIDEDAYHVLHTYLSDVEKHLSDDEKKEVMADIESRIAELFTERLQKAKSVISIDDVNEIIAILGNPSQYNDEDEEKAEPTKKGRKSARRFYRDPENAVLGGVAAGLAVYFGWDVTIIRILFVLLVIFGFGTFVPVYLLMWLVAPAAITASQRLEMQGEDVTVENIKSEINNVRNYVQSEKFRESASSVGNKLMDVMRGVFKVLGSLIGAIFGVIGVVVIGALLFALFFFIFNPDFISEFAPNLIVNWDILSPDKLVMLIVALLLIIGCPIFLLIYWAIRAVRGNYSKSGTTTWVVLLLWVAGLFMFSSISAKTAFQIKKGDLEPISIVWNDDMSTAVSESRVVEPFEEIDVRGYFRVVLSQDAVSGVTVVTQPESQTKIKTNVKNGKLYVSHQEVRMNRPVTIHLSTPQMRKIVASGACKIESDSMITVSDLKLEFTGASSAKLDLSVADELEVQLSGASSIRLYGKARKIDLEASGASNIDAVDFITNTAKLKISGACKAKVYATEMFDGKAFGASRIDCYGSPRNVQRITHTGSSIHIH